MHLPKDGVEYARISITNLPDAATIEASLDRATWSPVVEVDGEHTFLLRGPQALSSDGHLVSATKTDLWVRITGLPEVVVRKAGTIYLD